MPAHGPLHARLDMVHYQRRPSDGDRGFPEVAVEIVGFKSGKGGVISNRHPDLTELGGIGLNHRNGIQKQLLLASRELITGVGDAVMLPDDRLVCRLDTKSKLAIGGWLCHCSGSLFARKGHQCQTIVAIVVMSGMARVTLMGSS